MSFQGLTQSGGVRVCRWQRGAEQLQGQGGSLLSGGKNMFEATLGVIK